MERVSCLPRSKSDSISSVASKSEKDLLPLPVSQQPKIRVRALLGHCLYRRVIIWSLTVLLLLCLTLFTSGVKTGRGRILDLVDWRKGESNGGNRDDASKVQDDDGSKSNSQSEEEDNKGMVWLKYKQ
jgi:hypothetical protein